MNRLDIQSRDKVRKRYAANPLYLMIQSIGGKYIRSDYRLKLRPEEIFQILMGWIDGIKCESDNEAVCRKMKEAWDKQWEAFCDMAELANCECPDSEVEEYVCLILGLLHNCLGKLSDEACPGNLHYLRFGNHLFASACEQSKMMMKFMRDIYHHESYRQYSLKVKDWLLDYMNNDDSLLTDSEGCLVLQDDEIVIAPPLTEHDDKLYTEQAQVIWKKLIEKGWCEKDGSMLVWKKSKRSLGYMVKLVAHELKVLDPATKNIVWDSFKHLFKDLNNSSVLSQAKSGAGKFKLESRPTSWPGEADELRILLRSL
mgnify:FL=1